MILSLLLACSPEAPLLPERTDLVPLEEENRAPSVPAVGDDETPEAITVDSGFDLGGFRWRSHMRGWIHADVQDVWLALREPGVMADRRLLDSWEVTDAQFRPDVDDSYEFACEMAVSGRTFEFGAIWLHTVEAGDVDAPELVVATWEILDGPPFLPNLKGSLELEQIEPGLTEIRGIYHQGAASPGPGKMDQYWEDLYAELLATLAGEPLPSFD